MAAIYDTRLMRTAAAISLLWFALPASSQQLPVGALTHDGPPTPEQLSLYVPVTGALAQTATATVRYRAQGALSWTDGHPMFRVRPEFSNTPGVGSVDDVFAWTIIDLAPGTTYSVEATVSNGPASQLLSGTFTTRTLPPAAGTPNKTIPAGASSADIQAMFNTLVPGDVLQLANGTYNVSGLYVDRSGTLTQPIYIRGESRDGVVLYSTDGTILGLRDASHLVIENLTLRGPAVDSGTSASSRGIYCGSGCDGTTNTTIRTVTIQGVDRGIISYEELNGALVYDNTLVGNNSWNSVFLGDNRTWNDDGINLPGAGNVAFNNSISGFGDTMSYAQHAGGSGLTYTRGVHYYRNDIRNALDDLVEVDYGHRNITFYDNRARNASTCSSLDPLYGGPFLYARNVCINPARVNIHKWNSTNTGHFFYNNTFIGTAQGAGGNQDIAGWYQPNNGAQRAYGFRNNISVYHGGGMLLWLESTVHDPVDWTHNSWYPDRNVQWGPIYPNVSAAQTQLPGTTPVFSGSTQRMQYDNITGANPWSSNITLGASSLVEVTLPYVPVLADNASPRGSGAVIANITDGYSGGAPDRGALISGRPLPQWGDRDATPLPAPLPPSNLTAN